MPYPAAVTKSKTRVVITSIVIVVVVLLLAFAVRYRRDYGTFDVSATPVHLYVHGYRFEPLAQADVPAQVRAEFASGGRDLHQVGTWSLFPVVGGRSKNIVSPDSSHCVDIAAIKISGHYAFYQADDIRNNTSC